MKKTFFYVLILSNILASCSNGSNGTTREYDPEMDKGKSEKTEVVADSVATIPVVPENNVDADEARAEIIEQRMKKRQYDDDDQAQAQQRSASKTYTCIMCGRKFTEGGVKDVCSYVKDSFGNPISTALGELMGEGPSFCSQSCFDSFHEHKHQGHDVIY
jgi:ribosomal protein L37AE/L43A